MNLSEFLIYYEIFKNIDGGGEYVLKAGDTMTGPLGLPGAPTAALHAATKQYVDSMAGGLAYDSIVEQVTSVTPTTADSGRLFICTNTDPITITLANAVQKNAWFDVVRANTGAVNFTGATVANSTEINAQYAMTRFVKIGDTDAPGWAVLKSDPLLNIFLPLTGGTLTGPLVLNANPTLPLGAVTKQYVDALSALYLQLAGGTLTGPLVLNADPTAALGAATKQYVDNHPGTKITPETITAGITIAATDNGKIYRCNFATAEPITLNNPTIPNGTSVIIEKVGNGNVNFVTGGGISLFGITSLVEPASAVELVKTADTQWDAVASHSPRSVYIDNLAAVTPANGVKLLNNLIPLTANGAGLGSSTFPMSYLYANSLFVNNITSQSGSPIWLFYTLLPTLGGAAKDLGGSDYRFGTVYTQNVSASNNITGQNLIATNGLTLPTPGGTATLLNYYESGLFSASFSGPWASPLVANMYYVRVGKLVTLVFPSQLEGNKSTAAIITVSGLPVQLRPTVSPVGGPIRVSNNLGVIENSLGWADLFVNGNFYIYRLPDGTTFSASGLGGIRGGTLTYSIQ